MDLNIDVGRQVRRKNHPVYVLIIVWWKLKLNSQNPPRLPHCTCVRRRQHNIIMRARRRNYLQSPHCPSPRVWHVPSIIWSRESSSQWRELTRTTNGARRSWVFPLLSTVYRTGLVQCRSTVRAFPHLNTLAAVLMTYVNLLLLKSTQSNTNPHTIYDASKVGYASYFFYNNIIPCTGMHFSINYQFMH